MPFLVIALLENRQVDVSNLFIEVYRAYPSSIFGREDIDLSNNIILPPDALKKLSKMPNFGDSTIPILFRILNIDLNISTHCGVVEFTAEEGTCYIPSNMFDRLCLKEGQYVNIRSMTLIPGSFIKLKPHKTEFFNNKDLKTILEYNLRNYFCVTEGDTISIKIRKKIYKIDVIHCKPNKSIRTLYCNIMVHFALPKDYKEPEELSQTSNNIIASYIKINHEKPIKLTEEEIQKQVYDKKFSGHHFRIDENIISNTSNNQQLNNEENYNPRKFRILNNQRPEFKYVEL